MVQLASKNLETIQENLSFQVGPNCGNNPQSFTPLQSGHIMADCYSKMLSDLSEFILRKRFCETPNFSLESNNTHTMQLTKTLVSLPVFYETSIV